MMKTNLNSDVTSCSNLEGKRREPWKGRIENKEKDNQAGIFNEAQCSGISMDSLSRKPERKLVYYSDFDINIGDWKSEEQALRISIKSLVANLGESWTSMINAALFALPRDDCLGVPEKSPLEVTLEYVMLTMQSEKEIETRINELKTYYEFYGYGAKDESSLRPLLQLLLEEAQKAEILWSSVRETDKKFRKTQVENVFKNITRSKDFSNFVTKQKRKKTSRYFILNRIVTPLLIASERRIESSRIPYSSGPEVKIKLVEEFDKMKIVDEMPELAIQQQISKSVCDQSSSIEMHKVQSATCDIFSPESLKVIFAYMDKEALKFNDLQYTTVGRFAVVVFQLSAAELGKLNKKVEVEMGYEKIDLRVIKPFRKFYSVLMSIALRYGIQNLPSVNSFDFVNAAKHSLKDSWKPSLQWPTESFYEWVKGEILSDASRDISELFDNLKYQLFNAWEADVIHKSSDFKKAKLYQNLSL